MNVMEELYEVTGEDIKNIKKTFFMDNSNAVSTLKPRILPLNARHTKKKYRVHTWQLNTIWSKHRTHPNKDEYPGYNDKVIKLWSACRIEQINGYSGCWQKRIIWREECYTP
jgi:hypothetical protein